MYLFISFCPVLKRNLGDLCKYPPRSLILPHIRAICHILLYYACRDDTQYREFRCDQRERDPGPMTARHWAIYDGCLLLLPLRLFFLMHVKLRFGGDRTFDVRYSAGSLSDIQDERSQQWAAGGCVSPHEFTFELMRLMFLNRRPKTLGNKSMPSVKTGSMHVAMRQAWHNVLEVIFGSAG